MSAEAAVQTATLLQNKVGSSLAGVTSLLSPEQKSDVMLQAGASSLPVVVLDEMKDKFRDDFDTSCLFYINSVEDKILRNEVMTLTKRLAAADLIVRDREIKFLELVKKEWQI